MKKRFKLLSRNGKLHILHWESHGVLFGPQWAGIASFDDRGNNLEMCKSIIRMLNECDKYTNHTNEDD